MKKNNTGYETYERRLKRHEEELRWLYMELYGNDSMYAELCDGMRRFMKNGAQI